MKYISTIIFFIWTAICYATGQEGERVIYRGDTLTMLCEPLEIYLQKNEPRQRFHPSLESGCSTALWRGYVGLWRIENNRLFLVDVYVCGDKKRSIRDKIFKGQDSEIIADWFTGDLFIEKGKVIKYNHSGYDRYHEMEIVANVNGGVIENEKEYKNGVEPGDNRFSRDPKDMQEEIYKRINWHRLPKLSKDKKLFLTLEFDGEGKISETEINGEIEKEYKTEIESVLKTFPTIQVFYSRGQPINEGWVMPIFFSKENRRRYAR
ncbi:MAG: hypothetical protein ACK5DD_16565 [Cyclobacteriaceae bacterium]